MTAINPPLAAPVMIDQEVEVPSPRQVLIRRARRHPGLIIGTFIVTVVVLIAIFAPYITWHDPLASNVARRLGWPIWGPSGNWSHWLGTDYLGRDMWSRIAYGARSSLMIGLGAAFISAVIGTTIGMIGGYFGGRVDAAVVYLINCRLALPGILITLSLVSLVGRSMLTLIIILGCLFWDRYAVVIRTATQQICTSDYITAARAVGASHLRIMATQILPNVANHIIIVASLEMVIVILVEAALSYFGLGIPPPRPSWGSLIADGREYMLTKPYLVVIPGMALFILVVAINMLGDGIRDITAPEGRN